MRIAVLGPLEVRADDTVLIAVPGAKERLLLALLAAGAPGVVSVDRLVDGLWDGAAPVTARKSLQAHVVRLRSALEPGRPKGSSGRHVARRGAGYALAVGREELDALRFGDLTARGRARLAAGEVAEAERLLSSATSLWRGDPYADWPDAPFAETERRRLEEVRAAATSGLLQARLALGRHAEVLPELRRLVAEEPFQEEWWRLLMLALYRSGRQAEALAAGRRIRTVLAEQLGTEPGPALRGIEAAILTQDPALDGPPEETRAPRPGSEAPIPGGTCPYMGLAAYQPDDAPLFNGRNRLVDALVARLVDNRLLIVTGPSGAGKSSVVRAGLVPALVAGAVPGSERWQPEILTLGPQPVDLLARLTGERPPPEPVLLVCDQVEQLWAPGFEAAERTAFLDAVLGLLDDGIVARLVAVVRGDHLGRLAEHIGFTERLGGGVALVPPLTEGELRDVVEKPAAAVGLTVEPDLVDAVVDDVVGRAGALPLLSMALVGTWERRRNGRLTLAGYLGAGGVAAALARSAEAAFAVLDEAGRAEARRLLIRLADTDEGGALVRRSMPRGELASTGDAAAVRHEVVEAFVARRLLAVDGDRVEVVHEALLTAWPRLVGWLEDDAVGRAVRRHLAPAARDWDQSGRPAEELFRGVRLTTALEWAATSDDPTPLERSFLDASRHQAAAEAATVREQQRRELTARHRTRRLVGGLAAVLVVALVATVLAVRYERNASGRAAEVARAALVADANRLAAASASTDSLDLAFLLAAQADRLAGTPQARDALLNALVGHPRALRSVRIPEVPRSGMLGGGGTLFLPTASSLLAWRIATDPAPQRWLDLSGNWRGWVTGAASPTGDAVVGAGFVDGLSWLRYRSADGTDRLLGTTDGIGGRPLAVSFRPDGRRVAVLAASALPGAGIGHDVSSWGVTEFDVTDGTTAGTAITGTVAGTVDQLRADVAGGSTTAVVWNAAAPTPATLVDLVDDRQTRIDRPQRTGTVTGYRALDGGAALLWSDGTVTLYDRTGAVTQQLDAQGRPVTDVVEAPDGSWAATVGLGGLVTRWDVDRSTGRWSPAGTLDGHTGDLVAAVVDPQGQRLITLSTDRQVIEWDMSPQGGVGRPLPALPDRWMTGRPAVVEPGRLVAVPTRPVDGTGGDPRRPPASTARVTATFLDPSTGHLVDQVEVGDAAQPPDVGYPFGASAAVSPDGTRVAVTAGTTTTVLDSRSRRQVARLVLAPPALPSAEAQLPAAVITSVAWTLDGASLLLGTQGGIDSDGHLQSGGLLIRIATGSWTESGRTLVWHDSLALQGAPVAVVPSPDGRLLAVSSAQGGISIVDSGTLQTRHVVDVGSLDAIDDLQWSRDGRRIAAAGLSGRLYVIDTATWAPAGEPQAFGAPLLQVDWLRDERTLAVSALDGTVALVDADRGTIRSRLMAPVGSARADYTRLVPSPGGELTVLSGERPGRSLSLHAAAWLRQVCTVAGRDLTRAEWARYLPGRAFRPTCSDLR